MTNKFRDEPHNMTGKIGQSYDIAIYAKFEWKQDGIGRPYCVVLETQRVINGQLHRYQKQYDLNAPVGAVFEDFKRESGKRLGG